MELREAMDTLGTESNPSSNNEDYDYAFGQPSQWDWEGAKSTQKDNWEDWGTQSTFTGGWDTKVTKVPLNVGTAQPTGGQFSSWGNDLRNAAQGLSKRTGDIESTGGIRPTGGATGKSGTGGTATPYAQISQRSTVLPKGMQWPTFAGPKWDEKAIRAKARKITAPITAELGAKVQQAMSRYYENPNVRRMVLRDTLQGYGIGLGRAIASGEAAAQQEYGQEYSRQYNEAMDSYNRAMQKLMTEATTTTSSMNVYSAKDYEKATGLKAPKTSGTTASDQGYRALMRI